LALGALHEVIEHGPASEFAGTATLFTAGILARLKGPVLWCLTRRDLFSPGLMQVGLHPNRVIYAETSRDGDVLPLIEEGLHEKGLGAVVGEITKLGLTASRRLQLAAEASGVTALVIRRWWTVAQKDLTQLPTAALTRWRITPAVSESMPADGLGRARWQVDLMRCRGAEPSSWIVEACDAQGRLALPSHLAHGQDPAQVRQPAAG
jgi:protein ImuA